MKTRRFLQLASVSKARRQELVLEGLRAIGANVHSLAADLKRCETADAFRSGRLVYNAAREEAGKFLVLIDVWRAPGASQELMARQFGRAGDHLSKLMYAQMADYAIGSQAELVGAIRTHRKELFLDGPTDYDWIFRNDLLAEREGALYVDLVDSEGSLEWWTPNEYRVPFTETYSIMLVRHLLETGLVTPRGLDVLSEAWEGFDPHQDSHCRVWTERTAAALVEFPENNVNGTQLNARASFVASQWPMPMVELDVEMEKVTLEALQTERESLYEARSDSKFGG